MTKKEFLTRWLMAWGTAPVPRPVLYSRGSEYMQILEDSAGMGSRQYRRNDAVSDGFLSESWIPGCVSETDAWALTQKALDLIAGAEP